MDESEKGYIVIQNWMVQMGLSGNELIIFAFINGFSFDGKSSYNGGLDYLCKLTGIKRRTAINCLNNLVNNGLLTKRSTVEKNITYSNYSVSPKGCKNFTSEKIALVQKTANGSANFAPNNKDILKERDIEAVPVDNFPPLHVKLSKICREHGILTTPSNPVLLELEKQCIDIGLFEEAVERTCAKAIRPNLNYVVEILESMKRKAQQIDVRGLIKPQPVQHFDWRDENAVLAKGREVGLSPGVGESWSAFKSRLSSAIENQRRAA